MYLYYIDTNFMLETAPQYCLVSHSLLTYHVFPSVTQQDVNKL